MERSLYQMMMVGKSGSEAISATVKFAVVPILKIAVMAFMGFALAHKSVNVLTPSGRKLLNKLVYVLLLPGLIFSQLGQAITLQNLIDWWFIPFNVVLMSVSGSIVGIIVASIVKPPYPYFKFTVVHIGIGNIGNIPLVLIAALCRDPSNPFGDTEKCLQDGNAYISYGQWVGAIILYTYVYQMLAPPPEGFYDSEEPSLAIKDSDSITAPELVPLLTRKEAEQSQLNTSRGGAFEALHLIIQKLKIKQILQPPIVASILGIILGIVPFFKKLILVDDAPLFFITDSFLILGQAMIPCILLALGGNLVDGPGVGSSRLGLKTTVAIVVARLFIVPLFGMGIILLVDKLRLLPVGDKMFRFVLLLQHSMPTSVLSGTVSSLRGCGKEAASVLFWVHIFAVLSLSLWITVFLNVLF